MTYKIILAYVLDLIFGDPYNIPHPISYIGKLIKYVESIFYNFRNKKISGIFFNLSVLFIVYFLFYFIAKNRILEIYFLYTIFATKSPVVAQTYADKYFLFFPVDGYRYYLSNDAVDLFAKEHKHKESKKRFNPISFFKKNIPPIES